MVLFAVLLGGPETASSARSFVMVTGGRGISHQLNASRVRICYIWLSGQDGVSGCTCVWGHPKKQV